MDRIFNSAKSVYSWLGPRSDTAAALKACETANTRKLSHTDLQDLEPDMQEVVNCDYWTRVWVVQEFVLAREIFLLAEAHKIPLENVTQLASVMAFHHSNASKVFRLRYIKTLGFEEVFWTLCAMKCALPLDRLFALMGMLAPKEADMLRPLISYDRPAAEILGSVMVTGLVKDYSRFLRLFETFVAPNEQLQDTTHQIDLPYVPCAHLVQRSTKDCPSNEHHHLHTHTPGYAQDDPWPSGVRVHCEWSHYITQAYDVVEIYRKLYTGRLGANCICVLIPVCGPDCSSGCLGHGIAGIANMTNFTEPLRLAWAYILDHELPESQKRLYTNAETEDWPSWQTYFTNMATTLRECEDRMMRVFRVSASRFNMRTHLYTLRRLCVTCSEAEQYRPTKALPPRVRE